MDQVIVSGLIWGAAYALIGIGLVLCFAVSGTINLAQGEYVVLGVFITGSLTPQVGLLVAALVAIAALGLLGAVLERLLLRRVADSPPLTGIILTLGIAFALSGTMRLVWGTDERSVDAVTSGRSVRLLDAFIPRQAFWLWAVAAAVAVGLSIALRRTVWGRALTASAQSAVGAQLCGVPVNWVRTGTFAVAAAAGAVAGVLIGPLTYLNYASGIHLMLLGLIAAALGGLRSVGAAVAGGLFLGLVESLVVTYVSSQLKTSIAFAVLLTLLAIRPTGFVTAKAAH